MLQNFLMWLNSLPRDEKGQGFVEYAFIIVFVAFLVAAGLIVLGGGLNTLFGNIAAAINVTAP